ncbi:MAG: YxeA family protein [Clostridia bacterium]|nr:YxeA family protein [Clostridia bacterium]
MENIKEKMPMIIAVIVAIAICGIAFFIMENYETVYYTQIDNTKIQSISATDDMKYEYTLDSYNENGKKRMNKSSKRGGKDEEVSKNSIFVNIDNNKHSIAICWKWL